jgi:NADPH:quinone reductase-like Zn-dependent oxidoreductase
MRAYEIRCPDGIDALALTERDDPEPAPGQVRVRVRASAVNYRDLATIEDPVPRGIRYPTVPNSDAAGEVVAVGEGVKSLSPGDRVTSCFFVRLPRRRWGAHSAGRSTASSPKRWCWPSTE